MNVPNCDFLNEDRDIIVASASARTKINEYRNYETAKALANGTLTNDVDVIKSQLEDMLQPNIGSSFDYLPNYRLITYMNENIMLYLNRSMQHLAKLMYKNDPKPKNFIDVLKYEVMAGKYLKHRSEDIMLFASNAFIQINNLDAGLFKQAACTLFDEYDQQNDSVTIKFPQLKARVEKDFPEVYNYLFNNGLHEEKGTLMKLRNTAGHSDIGSKIVYYVFGNPDLWVGEDRKELYPTLKQLSLAYLKKAENIYSCLASEVKKDLVN